MTNLYSVSYNGNNATGGTTPPAQIAESASETYTFTAPSAEQYGLVKTGYNFMGWSESSDTIYPQYWPNTNISLSQTNPNKTLYAVWTNASSLSPVTKWEDLYYMQQMSSTACASIPTPSSSTEATQKQLYDIRDGKQYWIAKLKDGNCWMTQNLDLNLDNMTLSPDNSDVSSSWTSTTGASELWSTTGNNDVKYYDPGKRFCNTSGCNLTSSTNDGHDAQGNYYTFNAATAGTGQNYTADNTNAPDSICPKGWKLPLSGSNNGLNTSAVSKSFGSLINKQLGITSTGAADTNLLKVPLYFVRSGRVYDSKINDAGSNGYLWSSTIKESNVAYNLALHSSSVNPYNTTNRYYGKSIRCVAK